jgi:DNA-binding MarR family transcriptional regulator
MPGTDLLRAIEVCCQLTSRVVGARLRELAITDLEAHVLHHLGGRAPRPVLDLERAFHMPRSTLTSALDRLERRGLVRRDANPADRRSFLVSVTPAGEQTAAQVRRVWAQLEAAIRSGVSERDVEGLRAVASAVERLA